MGVFIQPSDLAPFATIDPVKAEAMIDDAEALALAAAPCLAASDPPLTTAQRAVVKAIIRTALLRWNTAGDGAVQSQTAGPFGVTVDTRQQRRGMFFDSELDQLRAVCGTADAKAFTVDMAPAASSWHQPWCDLAFGAGTCSCGASLTLSYPLWEY